MRVHEMGLRERDEEGTLGTLGTMGRRSLGGKKSRNGKVQEPGNGLMKLPNKRKGKTVQLGRCKNGEGRRKQKKRAKNGKERKLLYDESVGDGVRSRRDRERKRCDRRCLEAGKSLQ